MPQVTISTATMRVLRPHPNVIAFYDGRIAGTRLFSAQPNWLDDGAYTLGIASYAIVSGAAAVVYDTHMSPQHAAVIRATLEAEGVRDIRVVLSHWHLDHVAGNAVFADCEIIAHRWTHDTLVAHRAAITTGSYDGQPGIDPLVLPSTLYDDRVDLTVGTIALELHHFDIHSRDATVIVMPGEQIVLAGDTVEDTCTYVSDPGGFANHVVDLDRLAAFPAERILPNHGDPDVIAAGGYDRSITRAMQQYIRTLARVPVEPQLAALPLREFIAGPLLAGWVRHFEPYDDVHRNNVAAVLAHAAGETGAGSSS